MKEFKFIEFKKNKTPYEEIEKVLSDMTAKGREAVNMTVDMSSDIRGTIIVLLQRDKRS